MWNQQVDGVEMKEISYTTLHELADEGEWQKPNIFCGRSHSAWFDVLFCVYHSECQVFSWTQAVGMEHLGKA